MSSSKDVDIDFWVKAFLVSTSPLWIVFIGFLLFGGPSDRQKHLSTCQLENRIYVGQQYCGKACTQKKYLQEYFCQDHREVDEGSVWDTRRARGRDDYYDMSK